MELVEARGLDFVAAFLFAASRLDFTELFEAAVELARDALLVHADRSERAHLIAVSLGGRKRGMDFRIIDHDGLGLLFGSEREQVRFVSAGAVEAPGAVGEGPR